MVVAPDKVSHFLAGAAITAIVTLYTGVPLWGVLACIIAGVGKELYDLTGRGTPDIMDAVATVLGAVVILPYIIIT